MVGRLVEQQHVGLLENDAREVDARFFAAGEQTELLRAHLLRNFQTVAHAVDLVIAIVSAEDLEAGLELRVALEQRGIVRLARHFVGQLVHCCRDLVRFLEREPEDVLHRAFGREIRHLVDDARRAALSEADVTAVIRQTSGQDVEERGFSGAVRAQNGDLLARLYVKGNILQNQAVAVVFGQVLYGNISHRGKPLSLHSYSEYIIAQDARK